MKIFLNLCTLLLLPVLINADEGWGYTGEKGPTFWGKLKSKYQACNNGKRQSPIALDFSAKYNPSSIKIPEWKNLNGNLSYQNNGHSITVDLSSTNTTRFELDCQKLTLKQFHVHTPAEHTINGKRADMEAHFVFANEKSDLFQVFGVLFDKDNTLADNDGFFSGIGKAIKSFDKKGSKVEIKSLKLGALYEKVDGFSTGFIYRGSLTTPPCTEKVRFIISDKIQPVSAMQLNIFQYPFNGNNARPLQKISSAHKTGDLTTIKCNTKCNT